MTYLKDLKIRFFVVFVCCFFFWKDFYIAKGINCFCFSYETSAVKLHKASCKDVASSSTINHSH